MKKYSLLIVLLIVAVLAFGLYVNSKERQRIAQIPEGGLAAVDTSDLPNINDRTETVDPVLKAQEATPAFRFPPALEVEGKPVDALCLRILGEDQARSFGLANCRKNLIVFDEKISPSDDPATVFARYRGPDDAESTAGYIRYKYIGPSEGGEAILINENGGGTGNFSLLVIVARENDRLVIKSTLASGDRCNNGVGDAAIADDDGSLTYAVNITPYDFLVLAGKDKLLEPYKNIDNSAASCTAQANYRAGKLENITINESVLAEIRTEDGSSSIEGADKNYQPCFDRMLSAWVNKNNKILTPAQLKDFVTTFETACIKK